MKDIDFLFVMTALIIMAGWIVFEITFPPPPESEPKRKKTKKESPSKKRK